MMSGDCMDAVDSGSTAAGQLVDTLCSSSVAVYGVAVLDHELYVARDRSHVIEVYDVTSAPSSLRRRLAVTSPGLAQQVSQTCKL